MKKDLIQYYANRAKEYELIYEKPERQEDLKQLKSLLKFYLKGKSVLELACGTGYWTHIISDTATTITATDINNTVLEIAKIKNYACPTEFLILDVYGLKNFNVNYDLIFGGFIWSHIPVQDLEKFLFQLPCNLKSKGAVVFMDNLYVEGSSTPISEIDHYGNTYQKRKLMDGSEHLVLKNFPSDELIYQYIQPIGEEIEVKRTTYYWLLKFKVK